MRSRGLRVAAAVAMALACGAAPALAAPADVERDFRSADRGSGAMFRWWWPNAAVDQDELAAQLDEVARAGYKGVEIASVLGLSPALGSLPYAVDPDEYGYGGPRWIASVERVLEAAAARRLQVDLTLGAHWPPAVPGLDVDGPGSTKELTYGYRRLDGGAPFDGPVPAPAPRTYTDRTSDRGEIRTTTRTARPTLVAVAAVRCLRDCSGTPQIALDSNVDLTARVGRGRLEWTPPDDGTWLLVGYWYRGTAIRNDLPLGPLPSLYSDPEARAIDYFSRDGVRAFTQYFETLLPRRTRTLLRRVGASVFDESIEIGAGAAHLWTPDFQAEFERRRGYSLRPYLPILAADARSGFGGPPRPAFAFEGDDAVVRERVQRDVDQTYSDLYVDEHVRPFRRWARSLGLGYRAQPYGQPIDIAQAAAHLDVPECENFACGTSDDWRLIASGADLAGNRVVSDELIPGVADSPRPGPYMVAQRELLEQVNEQYALGANQMVFHGLPYPHWPPAVDGRAGDDHTGWPGFHPFGWLFPEAFGPRQPAWTMAADLSGYLARTQAVLQAGGRRTDVAVYDQSLGHIGDPFEADALSALGYTYGYVTPGSLAGPAARVAGGRLAASGPAFKALIVDEPTMPLATARRIAGLAAEGLPIVVVGAPPSATPGYAGSEEAAAARDRAVRDVWGGVLARPGVRRVASPSDVPRALAAHGVRPAAHSTAPAIRSVRRVAGRAQYYYLQNASPGRVSATVSLTGHRAGRLYRMDAWTGAIESIARYVRSGGSFRTPVELGPGEATIIAVARAGRRSPIHARATTADDVLRVNGRLAARAGRSGTYKTTLSDGRIVTTRLTAMPAPIELGMWDLTVDDWQPAGPGQPSSAMHRVSRRFGASELVPWTDRAEIRDAIGIGTYATDLVLPSSWRHADGAELRLGVVDGAFRVAVNGRPVGVADQLDASVDLGRRLRPGRNRVEVRVATTMINRVRAFQPAFASRPRQDYGLLGPVTVLPYADMPLARDG
jgi:hypothetical protein